MSLLSFVFEGVLAALMVVLIVYCVKLNRGLVAIRSSDPQINEMIGSLVEASDRAEASVAQLKAVGVAQERALRAAIEDAETMCARLAPARTVAPRAAAGPVQGAGEAPLPAGVAASLESLVGLRREPGSPALPAKLTETGNASGEEGQEPRSETEQTLLAAIRQARMPG